MSRQKEGARRTGETAARLARHSMQQLLYPYPYPYPYPYLYLYLYLGRRSHHSRHERGRSRYEASLYL
ncbi:hypothetical protein [Pontibacter indicus]|uniref:hypothetical protein n=1 Tax=Pontibacter indicus TaxID=1317125 RepID=UPI0011158B37|nr:hypothetical protein [Pontibacter indicus]